MAVCLWFHSRVLQKPTHTERRLISVSSEDMLVDLGAGWPHQSMIEVVAHHRIQATICRDSSMKTSAAFLPHMVTRWMRECFVEVGAERFRTVAHTTSTASERRRNSNNAREGLQTTSFYIVGKSVRSRYGMVPSWGIVEAI